MTSCMFCQREFTKYLFNIHEPLSKHKVYPDEDLSDFFGDKHITVTDKREICLLCLLVVRSICQFKNIMMDMITPGLENKLSLVVAFDTFKTQVLNIPYDVSSDDQIDSFKLDDDYSCADINVEEISKDVDEDEGVKHVNKGKDKLLMDMYSEGDGVKYINNSNDNELLMEMYSEHYETDEESYNRGKRKRGRPRKNEKRLRSTSRGSSTTLAKSEYTEMATTKSSLRPKSSLRSKSRASSVVSYRSASSLYSSALQYDENNCLQNRLTRCVGNLRNEDAAMLLEREKMQEHILYRCLLSICSHHYESFDQLLHHVVSEHGLQQNDLNFEEYKQKLEEHLEKMNSKFKFQLQSKPKEPSETKNNYPCLISFCHKAYNSLNDLTQHKMTGHSMLANYWCSECPDKKFTTEEDLMVHRETTHFVIDSFCIYCSEELKNVDNMFYHLENHKYYCYPCKYCDKFFLDFKSMEEHNKSHGKEKLKVRIRRANKHTIIERLEMCDSDIESSVSDEEEEFIRIRQQPVTVDDARIMCADDYCFIASRNSLGETSSIFMAIDPIEDLSVSMLEGIPNISLLEAICKDDENNGVVDVMDKCDDRISTISDYIHTPGNNELQFEDKVSDAETSQIGDGSTVTEQQCSIHVDDKVVQETSPIVDETIITDSTQLEGKLDIEEASQIEDENNVIEEHIKANRTSIQIEDGSNVIEEHIEGNRTSIQIEDGSNVIEEHIEGNRTSIQIEDGSNAIADKRTSIQIEDESNVIEEHIESNSTSIQIEDGSNVIEEHIEGNSTSMQIEDGSNVIQEHIEDNRTTIDLYEITESVFEEHYSQKIKSNIIFENIADLQVVEVESSAIIEQTDVTITENKICETLEGAELTNTVMELEVPKSKVIEVQDKSEEETDTASKNLSEPQLEEQNEVEVFRENVDVVKILSELGLKKGEVTVIEVQALSEDASSAEIKEKPPEDADNLNEGMISITVDNTSSKPKEIDVIPHEMTQFNEGTSCDETDLLSDSKDQELNASSSNQDKINKLLEMERQFNSKKVVVILDDYSAIINAYLNKSNLETNSKTDLAQRDIDTQVPSTSNVPDDVTISDKKDDPSDFNIGKEVDKSVQVTNKTVTKRPTRGRPPKSRKALNKVNEDVPKIEESVQVAHIDANSFEKFAMERLGSNDAYKNINEPFQGMEILPEDTISYEVDIEIPCAETMEIIDTVLDQTVEITTTETVDSINPVEMITTSEQDENEVGEMSVRPNQTADCTPVEEITSSKRGRKKKKMTLITAESSQTNNSFTPTKEESDILMKTIPVAKHNKKSKVLLLDELSLQASGKVETLIANTIDSLMDSKMVTKRTRNKKKLIEQIDSAVSMENLSEPKLNKRRHVLFKETAVQPSEIVPIQINTTSNRIKKEKTAEESRVGISIEPTENIKTIQNISKVEKNLIAEEALVDPRENIKSTSKRTKKEKLLFVDELSTEHTPNIETPKRTKKSIFDQSSADLTLPQKMSTLKKSNKETNLIVKELLVDKRIEPTTKQNISSSKRTKKSIFDEKFDPEDSLIPTQSVSTSKQTKKEKSGPTENFTLQSILNPQRTRKDIKIVDDFGKPSSSVGMVEMTGRRRRARQIPRKLERVLPDIEQAEDDNEREIVESKLTKTRTNKRKQDILSIVEEPSVRGKVKRLGMTDLIKRIGHNKSKLRKKAL